MGVVVLAAVADDVVDVVAGVVVVVVVVEGSDAEADVVVGLDVDVDVDAVDVVVENVAADVLDVVD